MITKEELLSEIPKEFHSFVEELAWDWKLRHNVGYQGAITYMRVIIESLKPAIKDYTKFMRGI